MQADLCRHIKTNGLQCRGVAIEGSVFCYFHNKLHRSHDLYRDKVHLRSAEMAHPPFLELPALEDRESIQLAISSVLNALATDCITEKRAYALFNGLYLASANARGLRIVRRPAQMVRDVYKEPWVTLPEANPDIAPPGRTCEIEDSPTDLPGFDELVEPSQDTVILSNAKDPRISPAEPQVPVPAVPTTPNEQPTTDNAKLTIHAAATPTLPLEPHLEPRAANLEPILPASRSRRSRVDDPPHRLDRVRRKSAQLRMFANARLVRRNVDAVNLVVRDKGLHPLNLRPQLAQHRAGLLRDPDKLLFRQSPGTRDIAFDDELRHSGLLRTGAA